MKKNNSKILIGRNLYFCLLYFLQVIFFSHCTQQTTSVPENIQFLSYPVGLLFYPELGKKTKPLLVRELKPYKTVIDSLGIQLKLDISDKTIWVTYFFSGERLQTMNISVINASQTTTLNTWQSILGYYNSRFHKADLSLAEYSWHPDSANSVILELFPNTNEIKMAYLFKNIDEN